jgi:hypothetical protein
MKKPILILSALVGLTLVTAGADAQVVPYRVNGSFIGNLLDQTAVGGGTGLHLGQMVFDVYVGDDGNTYDLQTAADGSQILLRRVEISFELIPVDGGLFHIEGVDVWEVVGGTKRFANVQSAGSNILSIFYTPEPVSLADPTQIPAVFEKLGEIDLGRKGPKN